MLIIIPVVSLLVAGYTTVKASNINLQYILYIPEIDYLAVSETPFHVYDMIRYSNDAVGNCIATTSQLSFGNLKYNIDLQSFIGGEQNSAPIQDTGSSQGSSRMLYYELGYGASYTVSKKAYITGKIYEGNYQWIGTVSSYTVYTNCAWSDAEKSMVKAYSNDLDNIVGVGITEETIINIVNDSINGTTGTTSEANQIQTIINNYYTQYQNGGITQEEMQQAIADAIAQLNNLNDSDSNTLADLMAINNALTYAQTVQEELLLRPSTSVTQAVQTILQAVSELVQQYQNGTVEQAQAMQELRGYAYQLSQLMTGNLSVSDVEVINAGTNVVNNFIDIIANNSELDKEISEKAQQSNDEELEYLESLETTSSIQDLAPSQSMKAQAQSSGMQNLLTVLWDNALIKIVLPLTAGFLVISVALGRKFKL